jgi:hypothetical protein
MQLQLLRTRHTQVPGIDQKERRFLNELVRDSRCMLQALERYIHGFTFHPMINVQDYHGETQKGGTIFHVNLTRSLRRQSA